MPFPHPVTARLWAPIEPIDRGEHYEDPLQRALHRTGLGTVAGGGSLLSEVGEIRFAELEIHLSDLEAALALPKQVLEEAGAPAGSELRFERNGAQATLPIGNLEGLAVYLDGISLPPETYENLDLQGFADQLVSLLVPEHGKLLGSWGGPEETSLYLYGDDAERMYTLVEPLLLKTPVCQNARIVIRHGNPDRAPRTVHLPRY